MTFQPNQNLYGVAIGTTNGKDPGYPHYDVRAPATTDILYKVGQLWIYINNSVWCLIGLASAGGITTATWVQLADSDGAVQSVLGTANQITASNSAGTVTLSTPSTFIAPGSIASTTSTTAGTTLTATLGNITASNGNIAMGTAGNKIIVPTGANASAGTSGVMAGTPGSVTVATTACSATALIFYARKTAGGTLGNVSISAQDGTGFTLLSTGNETSTFYWWIINA